MLIPSQLLSLARHHRKNATDAEKLLWRLDFYSPDRKLCIELDGGQHGETKQEEKDLRRTAALNAEQIQVLRFWNNDVLLRTEDVLQTIWDALQEHSPSADATNEAKEEPTE